VHFRTPPVPPQALCLSSNAANFWQCVGILRPTNAQGSIVPGGPGMVSGEGPPLSLKSEGAHFAIRSTCGSNHVRTGEEHPCWCQWMWSWIMIVTAPTVTATAAIPIRMVPIVSIGSRSRLGKQLLDGFVVRQGVRRARLTRPTALDKATP
jgi:hypothetical protein